MAVLYFLSHYPPFNSVGSVSVYLALAATVKEYEGKLYVICMVDLRTEEPVAKRFLKSIYVFAKKPMK